MPLGPGRLQDMTQVMGSSDRVRDRRRELLAELHRVELTLQTAEVLDRAAGRLANPGVGAVLRDCAERAAPGRAQRAGGAVRPHGLIGRPAGRRPERLRGTAGGPRRAYRSAHGGRRVR